MNLYNTTLLISLMLATASSTAQQTSYVLLLSKAEKKLIVLDDKTLATVAKVEVGEDPHEIVTSADGSRAYIAKPQMNGNGHEIAVVNLKTLTPEKTIDTRPLLIPHGLAWRDNKLWFAAQGSKCVAVYNIASGQTEQVFGTGQDFTHLLYLHPDGLAFYTTNVESGTVSLYEKQTLPPYLPPTGVLPPNAQARTEWRQTLVPAGYGCEGFDVSTDGKELWTARPDGKVMIIDVEQKKVKDSIDTEVQGLHRLKITPDGKMACIVSVKTGALLWYSTAERRLLKKMEIGHGAGIYMDKARNRMFLSCTPDNYVSVIDLGTQTEIRRIEVGRPDGITSVTVQ